jgi:hypothetical protein
MCSDFDKSPCVQNDKTKSTRRAPVPWMGAFQGEWHISYLANHLVFLPHFFCNDLNFKTLQINGFGALAG